MLAPLSCSCLWTNVSNRLSSSLPGIHRSDTVVVLAVLMVPFFFPNRDSLPLAIRRLGTRLPNDSQDDRICGSWLHLQLAIAQHWHYKPQLAFLPSSMPLPFRPCQERLTFSQQISQHPLFVAQCSGATC